MLRTVLKYRALALNAFMPQGLATADDSPRWFDSRTRSIHYICFPNSIWLIYPEIRRVFLLANGVISTGRMLLIMQRSDCRVWRLIATIYVYIKYGRRGKSVWPTRRRSQQCNAVIRSSIITHMLCVDYINKSLKKDCKYILACKHRSSCRHSGGRLKVMTIIWVQYAFTGDVFVSPTMAVKWLGICGISTVLRFFGLAFVRLVSFVLVV